MSIIKVNAIQHTTANASNMTLFANGNVAMTTANTTLTVGNTTISNSGISVGGAAINPLATGMKNRVINGAMTIDQRNSGSAVYPTSNLVWATDRYQNYKNNTGSNVTSQQSSTAPTGFYKSLLYQVNTGASVSSGDYCIIQHSIEGYNIADLGWGTATAKTVTVSFWVRSSITGTYGFVIRGSSNTSNYATTYSISSANTWEYKTITVPGPTAGTFNSSNDVGVWLLWDLGVGSTYRFASSSSWQAAGSTVLGVTGSTNLISTSGATFYLTGVQFEEGSVATPFEFRQYGTEMNLCMRYYINYSYPTYGSALGFTFNAAGVSNWHISYPLPVLMRTAPSLTWSEWATSNAAATKYFQTIGPGGFNVYCLSSGSGYGYFFGGFTASAEL
jgi:hypothetical protein